MKLLHFSLMTLVMITTCKADYNRLSDSFFLKVPSAGMAACSLLFGGLAVRTFNKLKKENVRFNVTDWNRLYAPLASTRFSSLNDTQRAQLRLLTLQGNLKGFPFLAVITSALSIGFYLKAKVADRTLFPPLTCEYFTPVKSWDEKLVLAPCSPDAYSPTRLFKPALAYGACALIYTAGSIWAHKKIKALNALRDNEKNKPEIQDQYAIWKSIKAGCAVAGAGFGIISITSALLTRRHYEQIPEEMAEHDYTHNAKISCCKCQAMISKRDSLYPPNNHDSYEDAYNNTIDSFCPSCASKEFRRHGTRLMHRWWFIYNDGTRNKIKYGRYL